MPTDDLIKEWHDLIQKEARAAAEAVVRGGDAS